MLPGSEEYANARELCRKLSRGELPSDAKQQIALARALAIMVPDALDTILQLARISLELQSGLKSRGNIGCRVTGAARCGPNVTYSCRRAPIASLQITSS